MTCGWRPASSSAFWAPTGRGKSTTIKMLTGLLAPTSGTMRILGADLAAADAAREIKRRVGVVPEDLPLFDNLTGREYLTFIGRMYLLPPATVRGRCEELLAMMDLDGEEKKVTLEYFARHEEETALAAALLPDPDLLFLDEPFEGVDAVASRTLRDTLPRFVHAGRHRVPHLPRAGDRREALQRRGHHRPGPARAPVADGRDPPGRHARRAVPRRGGRRPDRVAQAQLAGGVMEKGDRHHLCAAPGTDRRLVGPFRQMVPVPFSEPGWLEE